MKYVPGIQPEARSHHECAGRPVQDQANVELRKPPNQAVCCHDTHYLGSLRATLGPIGTGWPVQNSQLCVMMAR